PEAVSRRLPKAKSPALSGSWSTTGPGRPLIARTADPAIGPRGLDRASGVVSSGTIGGQQASRRAGRPSRPQNSSTRAAPETFQARRTSSTRTSSGSLAEAASSAKRATTGSPATVRARRSVADRSQEAAPSIQGVAGDRAGSLGGWARDNGEESGRS